MIEISDFTNVTQREDSRFNSNITRKRRIIDGVRFRRHNGGLMNLIMMGEVRCMVIISTIVIFRYKGILSSIKMDLSITMTSIQTKLLITIHFQMS